MQTGPKREDVMAIMADNFSKMENGNGGFSLADIKFALFTRSSQAGLTTVMVYCTVLLSIKLRNFKES